MKKKIIQILMAILFAMPGLAQTVTLEDVTDAVPGPVTVDLTFSDLTDVGAITLFIEYDDVLLGYSGPGSVTFNGGSMLINTMSNHRLGLSWINTTGQNIISSVISLEFDYLGGFSSDFNFTSDCELATSAGVPINAAFIDGSIAPVGWIDSYGVFYLSGTPSADVGEQITISVAVEGNPWASPFPFGNLNSIGLEIDFDPSELTYQGIIFNPYGFLVNQSAGHISLSWSSVAGEDFMGPENLLFLSFVYNGGQAELEFQSGSFVTVDNDVIASGFFDKVIFPNVPGTASLTIDDVTSAGATYLELLPSGDTLWVPAQVEVPILATGITSDAGAITLNLAYDADKLTYTGYTPGSLSGWTVGHSTGQLTFLKTNAAGMTIPDGALLTLKFDYLNGLAPISFRPGTFLQEPNLDYIPVTLNDGSVNTVIAEITDQPDDLYLNIGETGSFTVLANNASSYQWYYREDPLDPWVIINTVGTSNVLNITDPVTAALNGWQVYCLLQPGGISTNVATLYVKAKISGLVTYNNNASTPLNNCTVTLKQGLVDVATTTTDGTGFYEFGLLDDGAYSIVVTTTKPWGGVNVADATLMQRHIANLPGYVLTGLRFLAGDVTNNNAIAVNDVTFVKRRIANTPPWSFNRGDWVFESTSVTVSSANVVQNIKGLTAGDVNGSYTPAP